MNIYNWQQKDWPLFHYLQGGVEQELIIFANKTGWVSGILEALPPDVKQDTIIEIMLAEAIKTSAIEGEFPSRKDVLSSIRKNLGIVDSRTFIKDQSAAGLGELMIDVRNSFSEPLTEKKIFEWHRMLLGKSKRIKAGAWRTHKEPMQVISGAIGKEKIHFEAPPSSHVAKEMTRFIKWFNATAPGGKEEIRQAPVRAAIAHLYFETIHPFEDGNGRIGRAIAEKAISQTLGRPVLLSLSTTIEANKQQYYSSLEQAQRSNTITPWINYFVRTVLAAQTEAEIQINFTLQKARFFDLFNQKLNERQLVAIKRMFEEGPKGFEGGMNARKYISLTGTSKATATRDLQGLVEMGALVTADTGGGRSTGYQLKL